MRVTKPTIFILRNRWWSPKKIKCLVPFFVTNIKEEDHNTYNFYSTKQVYRNPGENHQKNKIKCVVPFFLTNIKKRITTLTIFLFFDSIFKNSPTVFIWWSNSSCIDPYYIDKFIKNWGTKKWDTLPHFIERPLLKNIFFFSCDALLM